jgi:hypothetical protein
MASSPEAIQGATWLLVRTGDLSNNYLHASSRMVAWLFARPLMTTGKSECCV